MFRVFDLYTTEVFLFSILYFKRDNLKAWKT